MIPKTIYVVTLDKSAYHNLDPIKNAHGINGRPVWFDTTREAKAWAEKEFCGGVEYLIHRVEYTHGSIAFKASTND